MKFFSIRWFGYRGCLWVHPYLDAVSVGIDGKIPFTNRGLTMGLRFR